MEVSRSCDVVVVGGGPVGLTMALLLRQLGHSVIVTEQRAQVQTAPAAHVINARTFEVFRNLQLDMDEIDRLSQKPEDGDAVRWVPGLGEPELGSVPFEGLHDDALARQFTPHPLRNLSQHRLEPLLHAAVGDVMLSTRWRRATETKTGVLSEVDDLTTGETFTISSRYVIGADGAGSSVRRALGITMDGPDEIENFLSIHVEANLRDLVGDQPATLYFITDPAAQGTFIAHDLDRDWVYMTRLEAASAGDIDEREAERIVRRAGKIPAEIPVVVQHVSSWRMTCQVANSYRSGSCFLVGDAAHRFPPTGGLGLNSGVHDAQNLAWKLSAVLKGNAAPELLDTYELERRQVAERSAAVSLENAFRLIEVWMALEVTEDPAQSQANIDRVLSTEVGRLAVGAAIANQAEHFDQLGIQLGTAYDEAGGVVVSDGTVAPAPDNPVRTYVPSTVPGVRLPHQDITRGAIKGSTLDLAHPGRFTLLTESATWADAAHELSQVLEVCVLGRDVDLDLDNWRVLSGLNATGAILLRPDQHVAWRAQEEDANGSTQLRAVLRQLNLEVPS